jgi:NAD(P)-dependent dehydrogenase (short-subunit alcohol dehydrogenase family)
MAGGGWWLRSRRRARRTISLRDKVVLITGGSRGLGLLLARRFGGEGARIVICARDGLELEVARTELQNAGIEVMTAVCDVARPDQVEALVANAVGHFGALDVLVNNAGIMEVGPADMMSLQDFRDVMNVDFWGTVHATLAALPWLKGNPDARIVNITSIGGVIAVPHLLPYTAAKFAAVGFSEGLRTEVDQLGIHVTTVIPGLMRTGSFRNALFKGDDRREYRWFRLAATTPGISMSATRAAERIVEACRRGEGVVTLGLPFRVARVLSPMFTSLISDILSAAVRVLPQPQSERDRDRKPRPGWAVSREGIARRGDRPA